MKALVGTFNQDKVLVLVGAMPHDSEIFTNLHLKL